jgi:pimeloyl-ACP methyl ester carboxylesterase
MNKQKLTTSIFILILSLPILVSGQINYGSNNGKYLTIRGTKIYYEEYGKGTPLILLHAGFGSINEFQKCIPKLSEKFRVIAIDAPGLGRSQYADSALSYQLMADYYSKAIDVMNLDSTYVIGWSDGAEAALLLGSNRPDKVKKILVAGANFKATGITPEFLEICKNLTDTAWVAKEMKDWIDDYTKKSPTGNWKRYVTEARKFWFEELYFPKSVLEAIKIPVLVVYGDRDALTIEHQLEMRNAIKNSQFCIIPNCSHNVFGEKPDLISQLAIDFFYGN